MTVEELLQLAQQPYVYLTLSRKRLPRGDRLRLFGKRGPSGRISRVNEAEAGYQVVACFEGKQIRDYLENI